MYIGIYGYHQVSRICICGILWGSIANVCIPVGSGSQGCSITCLVDGRSVVAMTYLWNIMWYHRFWLSWPAQDPWMLQVPVHRCFVAMWWREVLICLCGKDWHLMCCWEISLMRTSCHFGKGNKQDTPFCAVELSEMAIERNYMIQKLNDPDVGAVSRFRSMPKFQGSASLEKTPCDKPLMKQQLRVKHTLSPCSPGSLSSRLSSET